VIFLGKYCRFKVVSKMQTENSNCKLKITILFLIVIVIFGSVLRIYGLGYQSLWTDELASWEFSRWDSLNQVINEVIAEDTYPPGYYILLHFIQKYLGQSEFILRLPSAICGVICIVAIYFLGIRLYSYKEGIIAAALMAVLWCPIYYSQEARSYIFLVLFSSLSMYFWLRIVEHLEEKRKPSKKDSLCYIAVASLCCYTHYFGGYLIALQGMGALLLFLRKRHAWGYIALIYSIIVVLFIPWLPAFWSQLTRMPSVGSKEPLSLIFFVKFIGFIFNAQKSILIPLKDYSKIELVISGTIILVVVSSLISLAFIKFYSHLKNRKKETRKKGISDPDIILFLWLILPFLGLYISKKFSMQNFAYYYLLISAPPAYLLFARSITQIFLKQKWQTAAATIFILLFTIHLLVDKKYYFQPTKEQFREAVSVVIENDRLYPGSIIIGYTYENFFDYYLERNGFEKKIDLYMNGKENTTLVMETIRSIKKKYIWLISAHINPDEKFLEHISKEYKVIKKEQFFRANVWLFERIA
jgi:4-amino-4-deoxy-L-arabinose transferase-like glycosyltransferase